MTELRRTPLHAEHVRLGARLVPFAGFEMPVQYKGLSTEHEAVRERAGLFDVSHMGELWLTGEGAAAFVDGLVTNDIGKLEDGRAAYTCCCNATGTILDDLIVYRLTASRVLVVCNASNHEKISTYFRAQATGKCTFDDATDRTALLALQGPKALRVLEVAGVGIANVGSALGRFRILETTVSGRKAIVARTGYTGEDGVEIFCANEDAVAIWNALMTAGEKDGIEAVGLGARDTLRLEARLSLYGNEIDETTTPIEAGLGWVVKLDKPAFVGKDVIAATKAKGTAQQLVGFEMTGRGIARHGYPLKDASGVTVGICTSGAPSPTLGKSIGLGYLPKAMATVGTEFLVDCRGRDITARVVPTPFYKRPG